MSAKDALDEFDNESLKRLADGIQSGTVAEDRVMQIGSLLDDIDILELDAIAEEKPALNDLVMAVERKTDVEIFPFEVPESGEMPTPLSAQAQEAKDDVERLLQVTRGRGERFYRRMGQSLESGVVQSGVPLTQETVDALPDDVRQDLAERARDTAARLAAENAEKEDFPEIRRALERGPGRTVANYWEPLLDEFRENGDYPILREEGVSDEEIRRLKAADSVRNEFIAEIQANIDNIRGTRENTRSSPQSVGQGMAASRGNRAESIVPQSATREDPVTGETWTADPDLETRFMEFALNAKPDTWWDTFWFERKPINRKRSMGEWTYLQIKAGNATVRDAQKYNLPEEWYGGLEE